MSINILTLLSEAQQQRQRSKAEKLLLFINGRRFSWRANSDLVIGTVPLIDRMFIQIGRDLGILTPHVMVQVVKLSFPDLQQHLQKVISILSRALGDDDDKLEYLCRRTLKDISQMVVAPWYKSFARAGVCTYTEFQQNQKKIHKIKQDAGRLYMSNPSNIARKILCDETLIKVCVGKLEDEDRAVIQNYWERIAHVSGGYDLTHDHEKLFKDLFHEPIIQAVKNCESDVTPRELVDGLYHILSIAKSAFLQRKVQLVNYDPVTSNYILLRGHMIGPSIINMLARKHLLAMAFQKETEAESFLPLLEQEKARYIANLEQILSQDDLEARLIKKYRAEDNERGAKILEEDAALRRARTTAELKMVRQRNCREIIYKVSGCEHFRREIPPDPPLDKMMRALLRLKPPPQIIEHAASTIPLDMQVNLSSLRNPVEYFLKQMEEETERQLKLLQSEAL